MVNHERPIKNVKQKPAGLFHVAVDDSLSTEKQRFEPSKESGGAALLDSTIPHTDLMDEVGKSD